MKPVKASATQNSEITALINSLRETLSANDPAAPTTRGHLKETAEKLSLALETPGETVQRVAYYPMRTTIVRIANRLQLFHILVESDVPVTGKELAQNTGADHVLLLRLLRFLVATHDIDEAGVDSYTANSVTKNLIVPQLEAGINHTYDLVGTATMALPSFLAKTQYQNPTDPKECAFQEGFHTKDNVFEWFPKHPEHLNNFNLWMTGQREGRTGWLEFFPFEERVAKGFKGGDGAVMLVDVGGARGHEVKAIKKKHPSLPGRFLLQDLPDTIEQALPVPGMETVVHDFFTPQPIKGARAYYLRNVLHDWPDNHCQLILSQLASAMTPGYSKILLNELVLPNQKCSLIAAQVDITMMACLAATERSERQWHEVVGSAGLKIQKIWTDVPEAESIIELTLK